MQVEVGIGLRQRQGGGCGEVGEKEGEGCGEEGGTHF